MNLKRCQIVLDETQIPELDRLAEENLTSRSGYLRGLIDAHIKNNCSSGINDGMSVGMGTRELVTA